MLGLQSQARFHFARPVSLTIGRALLLERRIMPPDGFRTVLLCVSYSMMVLKEECYGRNSYSRDGFECGIING